MSESRNPELHMNEEPRNDFIDVAVGMAIPTIFFVLVATVCTVITIFI